MNINLPSSFSSTLLNWYDHSQRSLPWRVNNDQPVDPYAVWISEIMLQQTTVPTVRQYYIRFMQRWPTVKSLAAASLDEILHEWQGLGYYSRARNLHKCAHIIMKDCRGSFPKTKKELLKLPGVGAYTASAIQAIAFNEHAVVVDGNVERIISRLYEIQTPLPQAKTVIYEKAALLTPLERVGDYAQAMMDLGSLICTPRSPLCDKCPVKLYCKAAGPNADRYPLKAPKSLKPIREATFYWIFNIKGEVLIVKRPLKGLLGGMMGIPSSPWIPLEIEEENRKKILKSTPIIHTFTHFHLIATIEIMTAPRILPKEIEVFEESMWVTPENFKNYAFPTLMKKVIHHASQHMPRWV